MKGLTQRQQAVLDWIREFVDRNALPPTVREIAREFGISPAGVFGHLKALETKGVLKRGSLGARSLQLMPTPSSLPDPTRIPIVGRIAAGVPLLATENLEGHLRVDSELVSKRAGQRFALRVRGDSMIDDGIFEGDLVIVRQQETARDGDIVVALMDDETTLKRFFRDGRRVRLQPANSAMSAIYTDRVVVQGVVEGLVRKFA